MDSGVGVSIGDALVSPVRVSCKGGTGEACASSHLSRSARKLAPIKGMCKLLVTLVVRHKLEELDDKLFGTFYGCEEAKSYRAVRSPLEDIQ